MKKLTVESFRSIDVRQLARAGALRAGCSSLHTWRLNGEVQSEVKIYADDGSVLLEYQVRGVPHSPSVMLDYTPCHYGGERPWFRCPASGCGRRVAKLYSSRFVCRSCLKLAYDSQRESEQLRVIGRSIRLRKKLGLAPTCFWLPFGRLPKPLGMHEKTYRRLIEQLRLNDESLFCLGGHRTSRVAE